MSLTTAREAAQGKTDLARRTPIILAMKLLALETSTERLSVAAMHDERIASRDIDAGQRHSELALPLIREVLGEVGLAARNLDAIAFGQGPGSFTGVRIACGLTQGMAFGGLLKTLPIPTTLLLAEQAHASRVIVVLDARMGESYFAAYERADWQVEPTGWRTLIAPMLATPLHWPLLDGADWTLIGSALQTPSLRESLNHRFGAQVSRWVDAAMPRALDAIRIAQRAIQSRGDTMLVSVGDAQPLYVRNRVAQTVAERLVSKVSTDTHA